MTCPGPPSSASGAYVVGRVMQSVAYDRILTQKRPAVACKTIYSDGSILGYNSGTRFRFEERSYSSLRDLYRQLVDLSSDPKSFLLQGQMTDDARQRMEDPAATTRRIKHPKDDLPGQLEERRDRLLPLDLDDIEINGFDPLNPVPGILKLRDEMLPPEFKGAAVIWQITSSQKLITDTEPEIRARIRLYVLLDEPWTLKERKNWAKSQAAELCLDGSVFVETQPIYTADPIYESGADPIPQRWGLIKGQPTVQLDKVILNDRPWTNPPSGSGIEMVPEDVSPLQAIGYTPECAHGHGCHNGFLTATWHLVAREGDDLTDAVIEAACRKRAAEVMDSLLTRQSSGYIQQQMDKIPEMIKGAREKLERLKVGISPAYDEPEMSKDEAVNKLQHVVTSFIDTANSGAAVRLAIEGAPGLGKTEEILKALVGNDIRADVYAPSHKLCDEIADRIEELGGVALVIRGRTWIDPDGNPLCKRNALVEALHSKGIAYTGSYLCIRCGEHNSVSACPYIKDCPYTQQFKHLNAPTKQAPIIVRPHNILTTKPNFFERSLYKRVDQPQVVFADENFLDKLHKNQSFPLGALKRSEHPIVRVIAKIVEERRPLAATLLEEFENPREEIQQLIDLAANQNQPNISPELPDNILEESINFFKRQTVPIALLEQVKRALRKGDSPCNNIWLGHDRDGHDYIHVSGLELPRRARHRNTSVLIADGTLDIDALQQVVPNLQHEIIRVERQAQVIQVYDRTVSKTAITNNGRDIQNIKRWAKMMERVHPNLGTCMSKALEDELVLEKSAHFGALRGINKLKDCDPGVVIGRNQPPPFGLEQLARAIYPHSDLNLTGELEQKMLGYRMRDGAEVGVEVQVHPDPRVQRLMRSIREDETIQAIDRFRLIHLTEPKTIFLLSSVPVDVIVDEAVKLRDLLGPPRLLEALERMRDVLPLSPSWLTKNLSELFKSEAAGKNFAFNMRQWREAGGGSGGKMVSVPYKGKWFLILIKYSIRKRNQKRTSNPRLHEAMALLNLSTIEIRQRLASHHQVEPRQIIFIEDTQVCTSDQPSGWERIFKGGVYDPNRTTAQMQNVERWCVSTTF